MAGNLTAMIAAAFSGGAAPPVTSDPYYEYTTLLLPGNGTNGAQNNTFLDGSTNNFTITRNGNTTQGTFSPFSQTGWGNYFNGSSNWFTIAENAALQLNGVAFTIELFIYPLTVSTAKMYIGKRDTNGGTGFAFSWYIQGNASGGFTFYTSSGSISSSNSVLNVNSWNHIAVTSDGTNVSLFANGNRVNTPSALTVGNTASSIYIGNFPVDNLYYEGYMSNVRITKNGQLYSGATYTVPTSTLTTTVSSGTVSLLTCLSNRFKDESANNFTLTPSGPPTVVAFSPFNPSASWSAATYGGSGYFDGTGDYLGGIGSASNWAFMSNTTALWSLECWLFNSSSTSQQIIDTNGGSSANVGLYVNKTASNTILVDITRGVSGARVITGTTTGTLTQNAWNHLLITYDQSLSTQNLKVYINGATAETFNKTANAPSVSNPTYSLLVGGVNASAAEYYNGYISNLRISNVIRSSGVPTTPYTSDANTSLLLNFTNAGIYDATSKNDLETVGNAQISNTTAKFGSTSMYFDGTGDWLDFPQSDNFAFRTGDFTVEFWAYFSVASGSAVLHSVSGTGLIFGLDFTFTSSGLFAFTTGGTSVNWANINPSTLVWQHHALVRAGSTLTWYINGVSQGGKTFTNDVAATGRLRVGAANTGASVMNGYIQDLRFTKGYARYTANFTPPTAAFPTL